MRINARCMLREKERERGGRRERLSKKERKAERTRERQTDYCLSPENAVVDPMRYTRQGEAGQSRRSSESSAGSTS